MNSGASGHERGGSQTVMEGHATLAGFDAELPEAVPGKSAQERTFIVRVCFENVGHISVSPEMLG